MEKNKKHEQNWGGKRPGAGRKPKELTVTQVKKSKGSWGGFRVNAGRKPSGKIYTRVSICLTRFELRKIKEGAAAENKSVSRYVVDRVLNPQYIFN